MKTLVGDRNCEWGFVKKRIKPGKGFVLDFGPMKGFHLSLDAVKKGYSVIAVGLEHLDVPDNVTYVREDILQYDPGIKFDYILNSSTIEHVGLGRYGDSCGQDYDLKAMRRLREWMKPESRQLITIPVGQDAVIGIYHRVYGEKRLIRLFEGYRILEEKYWIKADDDSLWILCSKERALSEIPTTPPVAHPSQLSYGLGGFVLCVQ